MTTIRRNSGIYMLTSPSGKAYIGRAVCLYSRLNKYKNGHNNKQPLIYKSILKYGFDKFKVDILIEFDNSIENLNDILNKYESEFIAKYNTISPNGYNMTSGGDCTKLLQETKNKLSIASKNWYNSLSEENKLIKNNTIMLSGIKSRYIKGQKQPRDIVEKITNSKKIPIKQYSKDLVFIKEWKSAKDVEDELGYCSSSIRHNLIGDSKTSYGYVWIYS